MIYTYQTNRAMKVCYKAHAGQVDVGGIPYVFHPVHVAEQMEDEETTVVALLHDVVEDTRYTLKDLSNMGFSEAIVNAIEVLTHDDDTSYEDYIRRVANNSIARRVKIEDLKHNMDENRLNRALSEADKRRIQKYKKALHELQEAEKDDLSD